MLGEIAKKPVRRIVGLMSGTSVDGIDAALVEFSGPQDAPELRLLAFENRPFPESVRACIFELFDPANATVDRVGKMSYVLGGLYAEAALSVIAAAGALLRRERALHGADRRGRCDSPADWSCNCLRLSRRGCRGGRSGRAARAVYGVPLI